MVARRVAVVTGVVCVVAGVVLAVVMLVLYTNHHQYEDVIVPGRQIQVSSFIICDTTYK